MHNRRSGSVADTCIVECVALKIDTSTNKVYVLTAAWRSNENVEVCKRKRERERKILAGTIFDMYGNENKYKYVREFKLNHETLLLEVTGHYTQLMVTSFGSQRS